MLDSVRTDGLEDTHLLSRELISNRQRQCLSQYVYGPIEVSFRPMGTSIVSGVCLLKQQLTKNGTVVLSSHIPSGHRIAAILAIFPQMLPSFVLSIVCYI